MVVLDVDGSMSGLAMTVSAPNRVARIGALRLLSFLVNEPIWVVVLFVLKIGETSSDLKSPWEVRIIATGPVELICEGDWIADVIKSWFSYWSKGSILVIKQRMM